MRRSGRFTLLETLVGLALFGLIIAGMSAGMRHVLLVGRVQAGLVERTDDLDTVERVLRRGFAEAVPGEAGGEALRGGPDRVSWVTTLPGAPGLGRRRADVALLVSADRRLILRWTPLAGAETPGTAPAASEVALLPGVDHLEIAYWQGEWRRGWSGADLPALVKVRIAFTAGDPRQWPDLVMATVIRRQS